MKIKFNKFKLCKWIFFYSLFLTVYMKTTFSALINKNLLEKTEDMFMVNLKNVIPYL